MLSTLFAISWQPELRGIVVVLIAVFVLISLGLHFTFGLLNIVNLMHGEFLLLGAALIALANVFNEFAGVNYNAMLVQISTRKNIGRVSGFGWGMGYLGGIVALALAGLHFSVSAAVGFIAVAGIVGGAALGIRRFAPVAALATR